MSNSNVRIEEIEIHNFKNVIKGNLHLNNPHKEYKASILGLYGQNGSGKTALIDSLTLLKYALSGISIPEKFVSCINIDADFSKLIFKFRIKNSKNKSEYEAAYSFCIKKELLAQEDMLQETTSNSQYRITIYDECLSSSFQNSNQKLKVQTIIDTRTDKAVFVPKTKYDILTGNNKSVETDLLVARKLALKSSASFIFSADFQKVIKENCTEEYLCFLLQSLAEYGKSELFVISTQSNAIISLDALPLTFKFENNERRAFGKIAIPLWEAYTIPEHVLETLENVISNMNIVLEQLVPGLTIGVKNLGTQMLENGENGARIQLVSLKNKKAIPLRSESEGIKKIISILQLLIVIYNNSSITLAIDELDSGIFEYLLGELLRIISEKGKGQLIFTSHNLRPLETIDKGFIAFTTTNPENRYIRLSNVKSNNNLRDFYFRDIMLGEQNEKVYDTTNNYEIALAFKEAGDYFGK